jgi:methionyl-tRNA synthetase
MNQPYYLSAALPYVNGAPHLGHALEIVIADTFARYQRLRGRDVCFTSGTDDNSLKSVRAAERAGAPVREHVQRNAARFLDLWSSLDVALDEIVHTSADPRHVATARELWTRCAERGDIYRRRYRGLYCVGCEQYFRPADLEDGVCPEHRTQPELVEEENYFFRLSRYEAALTELITSGRLEVVPRERQNEVLSFIAGGLEDFSISRSKQRARGWGIPVPGDEREVIFVWFDALGNYLSALDFATGGARYERFWQAAAERVHIVGKGIVRFHAIYWPAILLSAGLPPPTKVLVHGYVTAGGRKIGKSLGNAVDPAAVRERYGAAALRYYLLRHVPTTRDGDFSEERLARAYDAELLNQLGNLLQRTLRLAEASGSELALPRDPPGAAEQELVHAAGLARSDVDAGFAAFDLRRGLEAIWRLVAAANRYADRTAPWLSLRRNEQAKLSVSLGHLVEALRVTSVLVSPFLPSTASEIAARLGTNYGAAGWGDAVPPAHPSSGALLFPKRSLSREHERLPLVPT